MLEIIALSPDNELPVAESLRRLVLAEWPDLLSSGTDDRIRILVGVRAHFEIDLVVEVSLSKDRPVRQVALRSGTHAQTSIRCGLLVLEVKQLDRERFLIQGPEIFPVYGREPSRRSVGKQVADGVTALRRFIGRYSSERVFVHGLALLTDVPDEALEGIPDAIIGHGASWSHMLQAAGQAQPILFNPPSDEYRRTIAVVGDVLVAKRFIPPRDRAALDRLTNIAILDGRFDEVKGALGSRQVRLAGRAGSGKSTTIALLAEHVTRVRQERLLVLTYHHALRNELDRLVRSVVQDDTLVERFVQVRTLVDFLVEAFSELGADLKAEDGALSYQQIELGLAGVLAQSPTQALRDDVESLKELEPSRFSFDYVCVDEAQDCSDVERDLLRVLFPSSHIVLADGLDQLVRRQTPCDWTTGVKPVERLHIELGRSLRMSQNIARFATAVASEMGSGGWRVEPHPELTGGRVVIVEGAYDRELFEELMGDLRAGAVPPKDLLVCLPPGEVIEDQGRRESRIGRSLLTWGFQTWNGCDEATRRSATATDEQIRLVQYDSMRGLEGWCTVLIGLDAFYAHRVRYPNLQPGDRATPEDVAQRWVLMALTRAARCLVVTIQDPSSQMGRWIDTAARSCGEFVERRNATGSAIS